MTVNLNDALVLVLILALIILVVIFMVLGIKLIKTLKKVDEVIDDVNLKMNKVNGVFEIIDRTTDYASTISDKIIGTLSNFVNSLLKKKKGKEENE